MFVAGLQTLPSNCRQDLIAKLVSGLSAYLTMLLMSLMNDKPMRKDSR